MPTRLRATFQPESHSGPSIKRLGSSTKRKGMKKVLQPTTTAGQPAFHPGTRAMLAAAYAALATGGGLPPRVPDNGAHACAAIGATPRCPGQGRGTAPARATTPAGAVPLP